MFKITTYSKVNTFLAKKIFSHTQRVSVTSDHPVSIVIVVVVVVGVNFFRFSINT